jgi:hypothetical protein
LNTGFFICTDDEVIGPQSFSVPKALVEIQNTAGLWRKIRIARKDPAAILLRFYGILAQPAQTLAPLMEATIPFLKASRAMSALLSREKGRCIWPGIWQAKALTSITTLGGKTTRSPASWTILETGQAFFKEAFAPLADDLSRHLEAFTDLFVFHAFGSEQNGFSANDFKIW